jgi:lysophospholipase L1-like esterase
MLDNSNFGGSNTIDYVNIQLGINDLKNTEVLVYANTVVGRITALIDSIHDATYGYPNARIIISLTPYVGNDKSGWSNAFFAISSYEKYCDVMMNFAAQLSIKFSSNLDYPNVFVCPTLLWVDRYYGYPRGLYNASARDAEKETIFTDSVHPDKSGYYQAADAIYSTLRKLFTI